MVLVASTVAVAANGFVEPDVTVLQTHVDPIANTNYGWVGSALGDLNGDGVEDYGVTAITDPAGGPAAGKLYIYSGADGSTLHTSIGTTGEIYGYSLSTVGDIDGDSVPDYAVGAPGLQSAFPNVTGRAIVYSGADHAVLYEFTPDGITRMGTTVADAGDVDGDGVPDILVGSENAGASRAGNIAVYSGADGTSIWSVDGDKKRDLLGSAADSIDDVDGDGPATSWPAPTEPTGAVERRLSCPEPTDRVSTPCGR